MKVKIRKLRKDAIIPEYNKLGDAGLDLTALSIMSTDFYIEYDTGLSIEIPEGFVGLIFPRSSISSTDLVLANSVGVIDSGYRGSIRCRFKNFGENVYSVGERVAQLIILPYPEIQFEEVEKLSTTERNEGGFGSTGK